MEEYIKRVCKEVEELLLAKNESYGNASAEPINVFSKLSPLEQINVRIDDKLNRLKRGKEYGQEDTVMDLIGYLILRRALELKMYEQSDAIKHE